jgi:hypothetical protein
MGHVILDKCSVDWRSNNPLQNGTGMAVNVGSGSTLAPIQRLTIRDFEFVAAAITDTTATSTYNNFFMLCPSTDCVMQISGCRIKLAGSSTNTTGCNIRGFLIGGYTANNPHVYLDFTDNEFDVNVSGLSGSRLTCLWLGIGFTCKVDGIARAMRVINGIAGTGLGVHSIADSPWTLRHYRVRFHRFSRWLNGSVG